ncbi:MAG: type II toxin-antitoxin system RelB/DinJ family antitoxin [Erysipelotrichaceae bacterium]|nr:type II toxin-antitoxin system RelB/DinJ family antitoxin [Erysipelotrichaceae bacterium]
MGQSVMVNVRMDASLKKQFEEFCNKTGMNMSVAFNIFASKVVREQRIPFNIDLDPFYSESNINYLETKMANYKAGNLTFEEHALIEEE